MCKTLPVREWTYIEEERTMTSLLKDREFTLIVMVMVEVTWFDGEGLARRVERG